jgi:hypothetical protein
MSRELREIRVPFFMRRPPRFEGDQLFDPSEVIPNVELRFFPVTKVDDRGVYRCMDCAFSNLEWVGFEEQIPEHSQNHVRMAQWYETRILPLLKRSK